MVKVIQRIDPEFQPVYTPPELKYKNRLLDSLNENIQSVHTDKDFPVIENKKLKLKKENFAILQCASVLQESGFQILNEKRNFSKDEYQRMFNEQLQVELTGTVKIKSIEKFNDEDPNVLLYVSSTHTQSQKLNVLD